MKHLVVINQERLNDFKHIHRLMQVIRLEHRLPSEWLRNKLGRVVQPQQCPERLKIRVKHAKHLAGFLVNLGLKGQKLEECLEEGFVLLQLESWHIVNTRSHLKNVIITARFGVHLQVLTETMVSEIIAHDCEVTFLNAAVSIEV